MDYLIQGISDAVNSSSKGGGGVSYRPRAGYISDEELNKFSKGTKWIEEVVGQVGAIYNEVKRLTDPWAKADHAASKYVKTVGMARKGMEELRRDTLINTTKNGLARKYNIDPTELLEAQTNYIKGIGRNVRLSNADQENMAAMRAVTGGKGTELASLYENFGVSMSDTADHVGKMFSDASKEGILFETYAENVSKNIKIAQNYTFKNGLKGLESMAKKATALKLDMQQVAAFADKVSTVEGAIDVSAKLQVLGGPFAAMADPLGMLNEGLNDMEGLQDRLIKMVKGMGSFDKSTGEVNVSSYNKIRIKEAANAMGISYDNLMESVNADAKRGEIKKQISASATASALPEEMKELIMNSGTFKDGKAGVSIRGQFKSLDELSGKDYEALKKETQTESEDIKDIATDLRSLVDAREGLNKSYETWTARLFGWLGQIEKLVLKGLGWLTIIGALAKGSFAAGRIGGLMQGFKGILNQGMGGSRNRIGGIRNIMDWIGKRIGGSGKGILGGIGKLGKGILGKVGGLGKGILGKIGGLAKGSFAAGRIGGLMQGFKGILNQGMGGSRNRIGGIRNIMDWIGKRIGGSGKGILGGIGKLGKGILGKVGGLGKGILGKIGGLGKGLFGKFGGLLGKFGGLGKGIIGKFGGLGKNLLSGVGKKILGKTATSSIVKGGLKRTATRAAIKILGKQGAKTAVKLGAGLSKGLAKGGPLGLVAEGVNLAADALMNRAIANGKMKKGGVGHHIGKAATGALAGAAWGSIFGPIGTAVGAAIGGTVGLLKAGKAKQERILEEKLEGTGIEVKGKYNRSKLKKINKALETGEISDRMRRKLEKRGDTALLDKIDDTKIKRAEKKKKLLEVEGAFGNKKKKLNIAKNRFGTANFTVGVANFNGRGLNGLFDRKQSIIGGAINIGTKVIEKGGTVIKAVKEKGLSGAWEAIKEKKESEKETRAQAAPKSFDININGSLKLTGDNGQSVDIISELRKNPQVLRSLADMIAKEISYLEKGTTVVQKG